MGVAPQLVPFGIYKLLGHYMKTNWCERNYRILYFNSPLNLVRSLYKDQNFQIGVFGNHAPLVVVWRDGEGDAYMEGTVKGKEGRQG